MLPTIFAWNKGGACQPVAPYLEDSTDRDDLSAKKSTMSQKYVVSYCAQVLMCEFAVVMGVNWCQHEQPAVGKLNQASFEERKLAFTFQQGPQVTIANIKKSAIVDD